MQGSAAIVIPITRPQQRRQELKKQGDRLIRCHKCGGQGVTSKGLCGVCGGEGRVRINERLSGGSL